VTRQDAYDIDILSSEGIPARRIRLDAARIPVTREAIDTFVDVSERMRVEVLGPTALADRADRPVHPHTRFRRVAGTILAGEDGLLLVQRPDLSAVDMKTYGSTWDLIRIDGTVLGRIHLPGKCSPRLLQRGRLTGLAADSLQVPSIVKYGWDPAISSRYRQLTSPVATENDD
jgi:hypothetical protein